MIPSEPVDIDGDGKINMCERLLFLLVVFTFGEKLLPLLV
jgi:hypothetical protein